MAETPKDEMHERIQDMSDQGFLTFRRLPKWAGMQQHISNGWTPNCPSWQPMRADVAPLCSMNLFVVYGKNTDRILELAGALGLTMYDLRIITVMPESHFLRMRVLKVILAVMPTWRAKSFSLRILLPLLLAAKSPLALAASFDCAKAASVTEKQICADTRLSEFDDQLNMAYKAALKAVKDREALTADQKRWVAHTRDTCADTACLAGAYTKRIAWLKGLDANAGAKCGIDDAAVSGYWSRVHGGEFEEMAFLIDHGDHGFVSWLRHQPEFAGRWKVDNCVLSIWNEQVPNIDFRYRILKLQDETLYLNDVEGGDRASYRRIKKSR